MFDKNKGDVTPSETTPEYQTAIDAKFKQLGWDKDGHAKFNGTGPVKTAAAKGYVQYYAYGNVKMAIYFYPGKGAFAMAGEETKAYDGAGQDQFAFVVSDPKPTSGGCGYNDLLLVNGDEGMVMCNVMVYGQIYKKYKELKRWEGPLGLPTSSELDLSSKKGMYNTFEKGQIYWGANTGAHAFWGKIDKLYKSAGYDGGWLGLPTTSCDINVAEGKQYVRFQNGAIDGATCGNYYAVGGLLRYQNGTTPGSGQVPPCY